MAGHSVFSGEKIDTHLPQILGEHSRLTIRVYLALRGLFIIASLFVLAWPIQFTELTGREPHHTLLWRAWLVFFIWSIPLTLVGARAAWSKRGLRAADLLISVSLLPDGLALLWASQATGGLTSPIYHSIYFLIAVHAYHFPDPFLGLLDSRASRAPNLWKLSVGAIFTLLFSMSVFCNLASKEAGVPLGRYWLELGLQMVIATAFLLVRYSSTQRSRRLATSQAQLKTTQKKLERSRNTEHQILEAMRDLSDIAVISDEKELWARLGDLVGEIGRLYRVEACSLSLLAEDQSLRSVPPYVEGKVDKRGSEALDDLSSRASIEGSLVGAVLESGHQAFVWNARGTQDFAELSEEALRHHGISLDRKAARLLRDRVLPSKRMRNILAVPMRRGNEEKGDPVGCILLVNRLTEAAFGIEETESLETIARQVAIAVTNFRHHQMNLQQAAQERFFNRLMLIDDLDELFQLVLRYLNRTFNSRVASLWLATEDGFGTPEETLRVVLRSVAVAPLTDDRLAKELEGKLKRHSIFRLDDCFIGSYFRTNQAVSEVEYIEDLSTVSDSWASLREHIGTPRLIAIPLRRFPSDAREAAATPPLGVACLRPLEPVSLDDAQRQQLERFANHLTVLMEQVRYRRRYVQLETLKDSLPSLDQDNLSAFYSGLVDLVRKVLNAEVCSYFTLGPEGELSLKATTADKVKRLSDSGRWEILDTAPFVDQVAYPAGEISITGTIVERRETALIYNVHENRLMSTRFMEVGETPDHQSLIGAPIVKSDGTLLGVLRCINKRKEGTFLHVFVQGDRDFLELTVGIMARFIENAEADESKRDFLNQLAHELASPLAALRTQIEFLEQISKGGRHVRDPEEQFGYLHEQAYYIQYIVSDIQYQFGRGSAIRANYEFSRLVNLAPMIERLKKLLLPSSRMDKQIDIITGTSRLPPLYVDARRMEQVMFNLLQNAVKYSRAGVRDIFVGYDFITEIVDGIPIEWHRLSVQNFGIGVREVDEEFIFDEYRRGSNVEGSPSGTGLGLAVAKKIVEAHGGRLWLTQRHDPTIFAVDLPASLAEDPPDV